jgi:ABC-type multidrug transport system fused ATPase/permease subunit
MTSQTRELWRQIWQLIRPYGLMLLAGLICMVVARASSLFPAVVAREFLDVAVGQNRLDVLPRLTLSLVAAAIVQGLASFGQTYLIFRTGQEITMSLRRRVQAHVARLPVQFFDTTKTGSLVSRVMSDADAVRNLAGSGAIEFLGGIFTAAAAVVLMLRISVPMTLICIPIMFTFGAMARRVFLRLVPLFKRRSKVQAEVVGRLTESINGVRVVKVYRAEAAEERHFAAGMQRLAEVNLQATLASSSVGFTGGAILGVLVAVVLYMSGHGIADRTLTVGDYVMFSTLMGVFVAPIGSFVTNGAPIAEALASLGRIQELLEVQEEDADSRRTRDIGDVIGDVTCENVSFAYQPDTPVLHGLDLHAPPDSVTALVGPSGAGKSTLIGLIAAFHSPTSGTIRVDGIDLSTVRLQSYRRHLAVVLQETFLFDGSIRDNIAFSRPGASEEEILSACRAARVDEFALTFPDGYDTVVGERGVRLSGGQKQRVSIARAILSNPRILILDEATSSLDSVSETLIQEALAVLMKGRTTFVIAHRLSTIRRADQILVLDHGAIVERGTHETLLARGALYAQLYANQYHSGSEPPEAGADSDASSSAASGVAPILELTGWTGGHQGFRQG